MRGRRSRRNLTSEDPATVLNRLAVALDVERVDWAVDGAVAANCYRDQIRTSSDLDILLSLADKNVDDVVDALHQHGWTEVNEIESGLLRAEHQVFGRLDVMVATTDYEVGAICRARVDELEPNLTCKSLAIEDVLITNLMANRFSNRADVESILFRKPELDWDYLSKWLEEFDLKGRLRRIETRSSKLRILKQYTGCRSSVHSSG